MKQIFQKIVLSLLFINLALTVQSFAANAPLPSGDVNSPLETLQSIGEKTKLPAFDSAGQHADAPPDYLTPGLATATSPILFAIDLFRYLVSGVAFLIIILSAMKLIFTPTEDQSAKAKNTLLWGTVGLIVIQLADTIVKRMFFGERGEAFEDAATAQLFAGQSLSQIRGFIGFVHVFVATIAVLALVIRGFYLITAAGEEEALNKAKSHITYAVFGLIVVGISEVVVRGFIFPENGQKLPNVEIGKAILITITNFISGFVAIFSFATLFYAGYRYVTAGGDEEVTEIVKRAATGAVLGLLISLGAFAIVNTLVTLEARPDQIADPNIQQQFIDN